MLIKLSSLIVLLCLLPYLTLVDAVSIEKEEEMVLDSSAFLFERRKKPLKMETQHDDGMEMHHRGEDTERKRRRYASVAAEEEEEIAVSFSAFKKNYNLNFVKLENSKLKDVIEIRNEYKAVRTVKKSVSGDKEYEYVYETIGEEGIHAGCIFVDDNSANDETVAVLISCNDNSKFNSGDNIMLLTISHVSNIDEDIIEVSKAKSGQQFTIKKKKSNKNDKALFESDGLSPLHIHDTYAINAADRSQNLKTNGRILSTNECTLRPQKYLSLVIINSPSRISGLGSISATESKTLSELVLGSNAYVKFVSLKGCNVKIQVAGQIMYDSEATNPIPERNCDTKSTFLDMVQKSHTANSLCCQTNPNFNNCATGTTWCWYGTVPTIDFSKTIGCIPYLTGSLSGTSTKRRRYVSLQYSTIVSKDGTKIDYFQYLDDLRSLFVTKRAEWASLFGDADAAQAWTTKQFYSAAGLAYISTLCSTEFAVGVCNMIYPNVNWAIWAHELGHNLGLEHSTGIMGEVVSTTSFDYDSRKYLDTFMETIYGVTLPACMEDASQTTSNPTSKPTTKAPTRKPTMPTTSTTTKSPSFHPTQATNAPTAHPLVVPTENPTRKPTKAPRTKKPTTKFPTANPLEFTEAPTISQCPSLLFEEDCNEMPSSCYWLLSKTGGTCVDITSGLNCSIITSKAECKMNDKYCKFNKTSKLCDTKPNKG